jgi:hypothetical protein|tara:strand:- start:445 stop:681 length:237 start_codon:yes stop_codon:yes gene_type:complete
MNKQPTASIDSWEVLTEKLLQLYAHEMIELCKEHIDGKDLKENDQRRADIRFKIIEIGRTLDEAEARYTKLVDEYQKD